MSRVAKNPIKVPSGVNINIANSIVTIKGSKGEMKHELHALVDVKCENNVINVSSKKKSIESNALAGTTRAILNNYVKGVTEGYERKLELVGVGYRAQAQGPKLNLTLGFSHPVVFDVPKGIVIETPSQTEILIKGMSKYLVGQVAAKIRGYRPPECYKGKGVRYSGEQIILKETKKK